MDTLVEKGTDRLTGRHGMPPAGARPELLHPARPEAERGARRQLRSQIARLERELGELWAAAFPRRGLEVAVAPEGGPRVLGIAELERIRDNLADRIAEARAEIARRGAEEEEVRALVEDMTAHPERHRWRRVLAEDVGERGCRHWHSRPRWGPIGLLLNWWRVKVSSGCPLATGRGAATPDRP